MAQRLDDVRFAANLAEVAAGTAPSIYGDPVEFFSKTHPTKALSNLLERIAARLNGEAEQCIWRLETFMGGGKTHALIALLHMAKQHSVSAKGFPRVKVPANTRIITFVGTNPPADMTMWGDIAYKIGPQAYTTIKRYDENRSTPGVEKLKEILGNEPTLILIDEIPHYLEKAAAIAYADTTLARQTVVFLRELLDAASQLPQCAVVLTLTSTQEAFGERTQQVKDALGEMQQIAKRIATLEVLTTEEELPGVVRKRLFAEWDEKAASHVSDGQVELYKEVDAVPDAYKSAAYHAKMVACYPFHPELVDILAKRLASIQQFNRTRGMLRLLTRVVRSVWQKKSKDSYAILPCDVDLADDEIRAELTKGLELHEFDAAIVADIANDSGNAKSQVIDQGYLDKQLPPVGTHLSNAIYLNTLIVGQKAGVDFGRLLVDVLIPGREIGWYEKALQGMVEDFWYLHYSGGLYFFYKEPTVAKVIQDEVGKVNPNEVRGTIFKRIQNLYERGHLFASPSPWPEDIAAVPDDQGLKLVILDYKTDAIDPLSRAPPKRALDLWENSNRGPRQYKNTVFFLVPDRTRIDRMNKVAREHLAVRNIVDSPETYANLSEDQRKKLGQKLSQSELDVAISIADAYRFIFVPRNGGLSSIELLPKEIGDVEQDVRQKIIYERLKNHQPPKIVTTLDPEYVLSEAWPKGKNEVSTSALLDNFYQWSRLPLPETLNVIKLVILDGIEKKHWVYYYGQPYLSGQPKPAVLIAPDAVLYTLEEAVKLGFCTREGKPIKTEESKPKKPPEEKPSEGEYLEETDIAQKAVERLQASIEEKKLTKFSSLQLELAGGKVDRALSAIFPALRDAAGEHMTIQVTVRSPPIPSDGDATIDLDAKLKPAAYEKVKQYVFQLAEIAKEEPQAKVSLSWTETPCDLPTFTTLLNSLKGYGINIRLSVYGGR